MAKKQKSRAAQRPAKRTRFDATRKGVKVGKAAKGGKRQTRRQVDKVPSGRLRHPVEKDGHLPGMEQVKYARDIDVALRTIADCRNTKAIAQHEEDDAMNMLLKGMRRDGHKVAIGYGVEAVRIPGDEKLRVRKSRAAASAPGEDAGEESGQESEAPATFADQVTEAFDGGDEPTGESASDVF